MEDSDHNSDEPVEGAVRPSEPFFPVVGTDRTPTPEMIAQGVIGNGAWDLTDASVEIAYAERARQIKEDRDDRRKFFNESAKDALADAIKLHHSIVKQGLKVMEKIEKDEAPTQKEMAVLAMAQKSSKELADRGMGRATAAREDIQKEGLLSLLVRKAPDA